MRISLAHNLVNALTTEDLKSQLTDIFRVLENALNRQTTIYFRDDERQPHPTFQKGDLFFDITIKEGILSLFEFNGKDLIPLTFGSLAGVFDLDLIEFIGKLDLIAYGKGSGNDDTLFMKSDGNGNWMLAPIPIPPIPPQLEPLTNGLPPNPEILFNSAGDVLMVRV